ncbi:hypothetical protein SUDANB176_00328 [Streptomyces sp. enrichment culture]
MVVDGRRLSFLHFGGPGRPLLALHGHFGEGRTSTRLAWKLGDSWRVIALDRRGHGHSDSPPDFSRTGCIEDAAAVLKHLGAGAAVVDDLSFDLSRPHRAPTRAEPLGEFDPSARHLMDAVREYPDGWGLAFAPRDMNVSQQHLTGNHWNDWLVGDCPALLVRDSRSTVLSAEHARDMAVRAPIPGSSNPRPGTPSTRPSRRSSPQLSAGSSVRCELTE